MKKIFLIERSPDVFQTVKSYLKESSLSLLSLKTVDEAIHRHELPSLVVLFGSNNYQEIRHDLSAIKKSPSFFRIARILILPFDATVTETECKTLDVQGVFPIPVERLAFQTLVSKFLRQAPRRVFRILVSIQLATSNVRYSGISIDFSETGMAFECAFDFPVGAPLLISFVNPRTRNRFSLKAEVVRRISTPTGTVVFYGVMFRKMSDRETNDIRDFIGGRA